MFTGLLSYLTPQTVASFTSKYNPDIRVIIVFGKLMLVSGNASESGPDVDKRLRSAFNYFSLDKHISPETMLVLGVAGGNIITIFKEYFPDLKIDAVDIDGTMIEIGEKYFGLDDYKHTKYIVSDAGLFVENAVHKLKLYDVIFIDLYIGFEIPDFFRTERFFRQG